MTANELADWIKNTEFYNNSDPNINDRMDEVEAMLRQQQSEIEKLRQALQSIANEHVELSHDKIRWQCDDHIRWAKEALK
jgi:regulator of replication initiation timing